MAGVVALPAAICLAVVSLGVAGCSDEPSAPVTRPAPTTTRAQPPTTAPRPSPAPSSAAEPAEAAHLGRSVPVRLQVAAIGVDSTLMHLGLRSDGAMEVPAGGFPAGWYNGGPTPGELGPAIIAGHVDMKGPGVFARLHLLKPGDQVTVTRTDGSKPVFRVARVAVFAKDAFPTQLVYGNVNRPVLRLITCGGSFNSRTGHYEDNIIAFAELLTP
jgi:Sortase domain